RRRSRADQRAEQVVADANGGRAEHVTHKSVGSDRDQPYHDHTGQSGVGEPRVDATEAAAGTRRDRVPAEYAPDHERDDATDNRRVQRNRSATDRPEQRTASDRDRGTRDERDEKPGADRDRGRRPPRAEARGRVRYSMQWQQDRGHNERDDQ